MGYQATRFGCDILWVVTSKKHHPHKVRYSICFFLELVYDAATYHLKGKNTKVYIYRKNKHALHTITALLDFFHTVSPVCYKKTASSYI
jgi:hypothetical protein